MVTPADDVPPDIGALHGSFTLDVDVEVGPADAFAAVERAQVRQQWMRLPGRPGPGTAVDWSAGVSETLRAELRIGDRTERLERRTHVLDVVHERRVVLTYQVLVDDRCRWVSLVTAVISPAPAGTRLTWTEQYAFLDPSDGGQDVAHLRGSVRLLLNGLAAALGVTPRPASYR